jgi:eukaryotic-like serine/threonine-protein kinase
MTPTKSVEEICQLVQRYQLMSSRDYEAMRRRWFRPDRKDVANTEHFRKWLILNRYLTNFVARVVSGRKSDQLVLNQYRLQDQLISGPMAGAYLAIDPLERHVAIEVLSAKCAGDKSVLMGFEQAAHKAMGVHHVNVGGTIDTGQAHGFHYLVKEYYEGQTLEDILERRRKLPYLQATRLMALALAGLEALHSQGVPAGDLTADCLLLAPVGKDSPKQRTVKILHAGVKRRLFDETAIGRSISLVQGIPDELHLAMSCTFEVSPDAKVDPADDIFRLGCIFYRCVTGQAPYTDRDLPQPSRPAKPIAQLAPEVPEMLQQIIEEMIDTAPAKRPKNAAHVAKALRVFLAAEEHSQESNAEENIVAPAEKAARRREEEVAEEDDEADEEAVYEDEESPPRRLRRKREQGLTDGIWGKATALWDEIQPEVRDLLFFGSGALLMLFLIFLVELLTGMRLSYIAGLATGAAASFCVEQFLRWRRDRTELASR